jgi:hypothetical protein
MSHDFERAREKDMFEDMDRESLRWTICGWFFDGDAKEMLAWGKVRKMSTDCKMSMGSDPSAMQTRIFFLGFISAELRF